MHMMHNITRYRVLKRPFDFIFRLFVFLLLFSSERGKIDSPTDSEYVKSTVRH